MDVLIFAIVNELSGTMDLESTLVRAESLFRRFQRTVETIDKKSNFPSAPQARQRKVAAAVVAGPSVPASQARTSGADRGRNDASTAEANSDAGAGEEKVVSDLLRGLLSRKIEKVDKEGKGKGQEK